MRSDKLLLRIEPKTKKELSKIAKDERRSMTSLILSLIDQKIEDFQHARAS